MNVLVTGGAGFIGSHLIRRIIDQPEIRHLVNLDALTYAGSLDRLEGIHAQHPKYVFEQVDLREAAEVLRVIQQHDVTHVLHLAAESHVDRSIESADIFLQTNVMGTLHLLNACRDQWRASTVPHRFVQVSTDEVYGSLGPDEAPFTEDSPLLPNSPYSASKAAADCLVRSYVKTYSFPAIITRCCNNYGPGQHDEKLIPTVLKCLRERRPIPIYGDGRQRREWIHVSDHAEALWQILLNGREGEVYNIGSGEELANLDLLRQLCSLADEASGSCSGHHLCLLSFVQDRRGHDQRYAVETTRMREDIGWLPTVSLDEGLGDLACSVFNGPCAGGASSSSTSAENPATAGVAVVRPSLGSS